jgi:hypothetical protein
LTAAPALDLPRGGLLTRARGDPHRRNRSKNGENRQGRFIKSKKNHEPQVAYKATSTKTKSKGMYRKSFNTNEATDLSKMVLPRKKWTQAPGSETDSRESDVEKCEGRG